MSALAPELSAISITGPMTHSQLAFGVWATAQFFAEGDVWAQGIVHEIEEINTNLSDIPGFMASFGLGYPFYAIDPMTGRVADVPAISEHIDGAKKLIGESRQQKGEIWPCATCQETRGLPDLKTECKPCDQILFKPRDLFKALPDIDVVTVFDDPSPKTEAQVQEVLADMDLLQSDTDIRGSFTRTVKAMRGGDRQKLPIDAHIWDATQFAGHCALLQDQPDRLANVIPGRALHTRWEDHPLNFWFDFVFSLTEVGNIDPSLQEGINETRRALYEGLGEDRVVALVGEVSERGGAILTDPVMEEIFRTRVSLWQNL